MCVAPPAHVGAWSMAVLLGQPFEYYYYEHLSQFESIGQGKVAMCTLQLCICVYVCGISISDSSGEFGIVYRAKLGPRGTFCREVAVKTLKGTCSVTELYHYLTFRIFYFCSGNLDQVEVDNFVEESLKMSRFKHIHVMRLIGVCLDSGSAPYIIMPYVANGSLMDYLRKERRNLVFPKEINEDENTNSAFLDRLMKLLSVCRYKKFKSV